jgi:hypothetical protein
MIPEILIDIIVGIATNNQEALPPILSLFNIPTQFQAVLSAIVNLFNKKNSLLVKST